MTLGPQLPAITPRFADFVTAADARRRSGDAMLARPRAADLLPLPEVKTHAGAEAGGARGGYFDALDFDLATHLPALLERSTALAAATRTLRALAAARGQGSAQALERIAIAQHENLPSQNGPAARSDAAATLRVTTEFGLVVTADIHVARVSDTTWEIAAFDQATASAATFPYAAPPLFSTIAQWDPLRAEFVAANMLATALTARVLPREEEAALFERRTIIVAASLLAICGLLVLSRESLPLSGAIGAVAGIVALRIYLRKNPPRDD